MSHFDLQSIAKHDQNNRYNSWVLLIELCRDLWEETYEQNRTQAELIFNDWLIQPYPIFRRLAFHSLTVKDVLSPDESLDVLLEDNGHWLWANETHHEKFKLVEKIWSQLSNKSADKLQSVIVPGPPRNMFVNDLSTEQYQRIFDRDLWLILSKLQTYGRELNDSTNQVLRNIVDANSDWELQNDDRDEFTSWSESWVGNKTDINVFQLEVILKKYFDEAFEKLLEQSVEFRAGRVDCLSYLAKTQPELIIDFMDYLSNQIWHACLFGLADADTRYWTRVSKLLHKFTTEQINKEDWVIAYWIKAAFPIGKHV